MKESKGTFTDPRDGKVYKTVEIGGVVWFAENLNFAAEGSVCYDNDPANGDKYGRLYDLETAMKACPEGWHIPSDEEWTALLDYAGDEETAGATLKSTAGWNEDGNGTDDYGFSALPGGNGYSGDGNFEFAGYAGYDGYWWSATDAAVGYAIGWHVHYYGMYAMWGNYDKAYLFSVRCVKD